MQARFDRSRRNKQDFRYFFDRKILQKMERQHFAVGERQLTEARVNLLPIVELVRLICRRHSRYVRYHIDDLDQWSKGSGKRGQRDA